MILIDKLTGDSIIINTTQEPVVDPTPEQPETQDLYPEFIFKNEAGDKFYQVIVTENPDEPLDVIDVTETDGKDLTHSVDAYIVKDSVTSEYYAFYVADVDGNISLEVYGPGNPSDGDVVVDYIDFSSNGSNYRLEYKNHNINLIKE